MPVALPRRQANHLSGAEGYTSTGMRWCISRWLLLLACTPLLLAGNPDPGLLLEVDLSRFEVRARDLAAGLDGPVLPVALGSPGHPTPRGDFPLYTLVRNPDWKPGPVARSRGAEAVGPSPAGPLGVGKLPFAGGEIALHGGASPLLVGKPVSLGCARATDADLLRLIDWLEERQALVAEPRDIGGELHRAFRRPARVVVR